MTAWFLSYPCLPRGVLHGGNSGASTGYAGGSIREYAWLFGWDVGVSRILVGANTRRSVNTLVCYVVKIVQARGMGQY
jgi:hypothetical protein